MTAARPGGDDDRDEGGAIRVRAASEEDATAVRLVVAEMLLAEGFDAPDPERDADVADPAYYRQPGRGMWVATNAAGEVVGCAALDRGDGRLALLRRLAGRGLPDLTRAVIAFARERGYAGIETVVPPAMADARRAVEGEGFAPAGPRNHLLLRRAL